MPTEEQMTVNERRKYMKLVKPRYQQAKRAERSRLLSEMEQVTGLHRKSLLRLLHSSSLTRKKRTTVRQRTYGLATEQVILVVWESLDYVCAERLTPVSTFDGTAPGAFRQRALEQGSRAAVRADKRSHRHTSVASAP